MEGANPPEGRDLYDSECRALWLTERQVEAVGELSAH